MIQANELRIGNYLKRLDGSVFQVETTDFVDIHAYPQYLSPIPIPISEEWAEKLPNDEWEFVGFETRIIYQHNKYRAIKLEFSNNSVAFYFNDELINLKQYVHQLQNLYFSLTGEELTINK